MKYKKADNSASSQFCLFEDNGTVITVVSLVDLFTFPEHKFCSVLCVIPSSIFFLHLCTLANIT